MPLLTRQRSQRGFPKVPVTWSAVLVWVLVLLVGSYRSVCSLRRWKSSTLLLFKGTTSILHMRNTEILTWKELYSVHTSRKDESDVTKAKPRTWPADYESIPQTSGNASSGPIAVSREESRNVTLHKLKEFPSSCKPRADWHTFSFPNCNLFHEVDIKSGLTTTTRDVRINYGFAGATRESWLLESPTHTCGEPYSSSTTILKTLRYREVLDEAIVEKQRIDAVVSERLTKSPHVIDIYGFCGTSALNEYADGGMFASTLRHQYSDGGNYTDRELLIFARDAALSLADIHDIDGRDNVTSIVHHDLRAENFLTSNGTLKISDFNNGQLLRWDEKKNKRCYGFHWSGGCGETMEKTNRKAPEECLEVENRTLTTEKVEVYRFGAFLYYLISAGNWTYSYERSSNGTLGRPKPATVKKMILAGKKPSLPPYVQQTNSSDIKAIVHAMRMAHTHDANERPRAREIAEYLERAATKPPQGKAVTVHHRQ